jgi:hypothetical protein
MQARQEKLKNLLAKVPPGFLVDSEWLNRHGIADRLLHHYEQAGWLERVVRGVYRRPASTGETAGAHDTWQTVLVSAQRVMDYDFHLGGMSALAFHGHAHFLSFGGAESVSVYGDPPHWLTKLPLDTRWILRTRALFGDAREEIEEASSALTGWPLLASSRERAILEALNELPRHDSFDNVDMVFESLTSLRPRRLMTLLTLCRSIKVRRLFFVFADRHNHGWLKHLDRAAVDLGSGPRALVEGGKLHPLYKIYVPTAFAARDEQGSPDGT